MTTRPSSDPHAVVSDVFAFGQHEQMVGPLRRKQLPEFWLSLEELSFESPYGASFWHALSYYRQLSVRK